MNPRSIIFYKSSMDAPSSTRKAVVVGAGPVGCLCAIALAKQGWSVDVYEGRPGRYPPRLRVNCAEFLTERPSDIRLPSSKAVSQQRSINLAMSSRGIAALKAIDPGATDRFLNAVIPMRGRMIHDIHGKLDSQPYDRNGQVSALFHPQSAVGARLTHACFCTHTWI